MHFRFLVVFILISNLASAQKIEVDALVNDIKNGLDFSIDETLIREKVEFYLKRPLNLNTASEAELEDFLFLNTFQVQAILNYRNKLNGFVEVKELVTLPHFSPSIEKFFPLMTISVMETEITGQQLRHFLVFGYGRQEDRSVYKNNPNSDFLGNPNEYFLRYSFERTKGLSFGFTMQNDYYEPFFQHHNTPSFQHGKTGFDYSSAYISYKSKGIFRQVILGDYALYFGQGLSFWNGFSLNKSIYSTQVEKNNAEVRPYTSAGEFNYLRGLLLDLKLNNNFDLTLFGSGKNLSALERNINGENYYSIDEIGSNRQDKDNKVFLKEYLVGGRIKYSFKKGNVALTGFSSEYSGKVNPQNGIYDQLEFRDKNLNAASLDYTLQPLPYLRFFGEGAIQTHGASAVLQGISVAPNPFWEMVLLYRNLSSNYFSHYANVFQEKSTPNNEEGIYLGLKWQPINWLSISFYQDNFKSKWISYRTLSPTSGNETLIRATFFPTENAEFFIQFKRESLNYNDFQEGKEFTKQGEKYQIRLQSDYTVSEELELRSRIESRWLESNKNAVSFLFYQDFKWSPNYNLKFTLRFAKAWVEDSEVTIYSQDSEVPYSYSITQFTRNATQLYLIIKYKINKKLSLWLKTSNLTGDWKEESNTLRSEKTFIKTRIQYDF